MCECLYVCMYYDMQPVLLNTRAHNFAFSPVTNIVPAGRVGCP